jgi:hypothetical protein
MVVGEFELLRPWARTPKARSTSATAHMRIVVIFGRMRCRQTEIANCRQGELPLAIISG